MRGLALVFVVACGGSSHAPDSALAVDAGPLVPTANADREVTDTKLAFDVTALTGTATVTLAASTTPGGTLEVGDLVIQSVKVAGEDVAYTVTNKQLDLALPASDAPIAVDFAYTYRQYIGFSGAGTGGYTFLWPYYCGNLFPCHSAPSDGTTFSLELAGVPADKLAIYPTTLPTEAPSYQIAWTIDAYTELPLGTTTAGTQVSVWYRGPAELTKAQTGTQHLVAAFDWLETTLGPYRFGSKVGTVSVKWPQGAYGGMEHHPFWHVASGALGDELTNVHEAAHGWFGDGIRIGCWEDFVLSEGTVSYLEARALDAVAPEGSAARWTTLANELAQVRGVDPVWPQTCGAVDVIADNLYTDAPYMRGAFFYRALALKLGAPMVDAVLHTYYAAHAGKSGHMAEMLATIHDVTGYDATACAQTWLRGTTTPTPGPCP